MAFGSKTDTGSDLTKPIENRKGGERERERTRRTERELSNRVVSQAIPSAERGQIVVSILGKWP